MALQVAHYPFNITIRPNPYKYIQKTQGVNQYYSISKAIATTPVSNR